MNPQDVSRRDFLLMGAVTTAAVVALPKFSLADVRQVSVSDCMDMSPEEMARQSKLVTDSYAYLMTAIDSIQDPALRKSVKDIIENPAPTMMTGLMDPAARKDAYGKMQSMGFVEKTSEADFLPAGDPQKSPQPFLSAPGSGYTSHHAYPGGVVTHTAANVMLSQALYDAYKKTYGFDMDRDVIIASQVLHDLHKPWVFQWGDNAESRTEHPLAGTGQHHPLGVAESIHRGLPASVCVAQACAHNHPGFAKDEEGPVNWIKAACALVEKDPVAAGLLAEDGATLPVPRQMEGFICHLGDHDWVLTVPAAKWMIPVLEEVAVESYGLSEDDLKGRKFNALRNYVFSQATIMTLYNIYSAQGKDVLKKTVFEIVKPV
ncbi:hypothetical protein [Desulfovibrio inopinatus]|uniref:hypothetical protein n=1 Tax=Desulfovibrio inopinatus TaxID=102109 RepID=UPI000486376E|nr:hypothetical protein [Desulfovibrio inopinatus]